MDTAIIRQGELVGRGIMAYETTEEVGSVEHLLVDMKTARVVGLTYKTPGLIGRKQSLDWAQLVKIGGDRIVIQTEVPEAIESQLSASQDITDLEVWTDGGDHIGQVIDVCFDQSTGQVQQYLFVLKAATELEADDDWPDDPIDN
ncbi:MAG: PRC-barrel domain-containing protein, partial [Phormidesmis sp.]